VLAVASEPKHFGIGSLWWLAREGGGPQKKGRRIWAVFEWRMSGPEALASLPVPVVNRPGP